MQSCFLHNYLYTHIIFILYNTVIHLSLPPQLNSLPILVYVVQVTFTNEQTGEYQFYHVHFKSTQPGVMGTIELTTPVRKSASHTITIDNPFPTSVTMNTTVNVPDITIPNSFLIGAESQVCLLVCSYRKKCGNTIMGTQTFENIFATTCIDEAISCY